MISGKEALDAIMNGQEVEYLENDNKWKLIDKDFIVISALTDCKLRLKPRTITINSPKHVAQHLSGRKVEITFKSHHDASVFFNEMQEVMFNDH